MHPFVQQSVPPHHLAVHWFGQSSYAIQSPGGTLLLIDPCFPHDRPTEKFIHPTPPLIGYNESRLLSA